jgi:hypothetical protein
LPTEYQSALLLILWRNYWNDRNAVTHGGPTLSIEESARALKSLQNTLYQTTQVHNILLVDVKGEAAMNIFAKKVNNKTPKKLMPKLMWQPPEDGWIKINVDGSFVEATAQASALSRYCHSGSFRTNYGRSKIPRVSNTSPSAKNRALGEATFPRVLHSGKNCTRGREAFPSADECPTLGEDRHSQKEICI